MDFAFTQDQQDIFAAIKEFCDEELAPKAKETDERGDFPWETVRQVAEMDLMGIPVPEEYGGMGMDFLTWTVAAEYLSTACTTTGAVFGAHMLALYPIMAYGTDEQKAKYLPALATGEKIGAFGLTEPNAGSDQSTIATRAERDGDDYVLNGTKIFITNGGEAEIYVIIATVGQRLGVRGLTAFIVEKGTPGFEFGKNEKKMAYKSLSNRELIFDDCRVPAGNMLLTEKRGFRVAMGTLGVGRIGMAIGAVGLAQAALDAAVPYSKTRVQYGQTIENFQAIQFMIADMATEIQAARLLSYQAAWMKDQGLEFEKVAAMAKLYASEACSRVTSKAVQIHGGYGYTAEFPVERYFREAKLFEIVEGTSEIQRLVIANRVLKEYADKKR
ncbi:MAG: acyl-CoA dehydrogenase [Armatimonadetes bacterium]|nr:acyl-CoA dehydrogenase [Armatimonadota bacterium]